MGMARNLEPGAKASRTGAYTAVAMHPRIQKLDAKTPFAAHDFV